MGGWDKGSLLCLLIAVLAFLTISITSAQEDDVTNCVPYPRCLLTQERHLFDAPWPLPVFKSRPRPQGKRMFQSWDPNAFQRRSYQCNCDCGWSLSASELSSQVGNGFPWLVRIARLTTAPNGGNRLVTICSGTLLNRNYVLTAAHCVSNQASTPHQLLVILGDGGRSTQSRESSILVQVVDVIVHTDYDPDSFDSDIALLKLLPSKINYNTLVAPVCLPPLDIDNDGRKGVALAWGRKNLQDSQEESSDEEPQPSDLVKASVSIRSGRLCEEESSNFTYSSITENMLCVDLNQDSSPSNPVCKGDSGGPLLVKNSRSRYEIRGVAVRFVGCAEFGYPTIYADVSKYIPWIAQTTGSHCITCQ